jgi:hypothetical protein
LYLADVETESGEAYERTERLSLAITIVPALTVIDWQIIAGESATTRFVVMDVTNLCDADAELTFGADQRMINVQPRELCRVLLLCPCSTEIHAAEFQQASQRASYIMQKQEIEQLRRRLEKHISTHLEIKWKIAALQVSHDFCGLKERFLARRISSGWAVVGVGFVSQAVGCAEYFAL